MKSKEELEKSPAYWKEKAENWKWRYDQLKAESNNTKHPREEGTAEEYLKDREIEDIEVTGIVKGFKFKGNLSQHMETYSLRKSQPLSKEISEEKITKLSLEMWNTKMFNNKWDSSIDCKSVIKRVLSSLNINTNSKRPLKCCDVPTHLHATSCGWNNVVIIHNGQSITGDDLKNIYGQLKQD